MTGLTPSDSPSRVGSGSSSPFASLTTPVGEFKVYDIGTPGTPWGDSERLAWRQRQQIQRSYQDDVFTPLSNLVAKPSSMAELVRYGELDYSAVGQGVYDLYAVAPKVIDPGKPIMLITGGVHGYETSGVKGAIRFLERHFEELSKQVNLIVLPCISPWGYETINRWNPLAVDPNRSFNPNSPGCKEAELAMSYLKGILDRLDIEAPLVHIDLHETTDTDNSEFTPAKIARDGKPEPWSPIPDGFYLVDDFENPRLGFQEAMIAAVKKVTHIAQADSDGCLVGDKVCSEGIIQFPAKSLFLCMGFSGARFTSTTEVYPDSSKTNPEQCIDAQVACVLAGIKYALAHQSDS